MSKHVTLSTTTSQGQSLDQLSYELDEAMTQLQARDEEYKVADRARSAARERVNKAQKAIDGHIASLRKDAPWDTKWHNDERHPRKNAIPAAVGDNGVR